MALAMLHAPDESARGFLGDLLPELGQELLLLLASCLLHVCPVLAGLQLLHPVLPVSHFLKNFNLRKLTLKKNS